MSLEITLARLEGKVDVLSERISGQGAASSETARQMQKGIDDLHNKVDQYREEARHDASAVRQDLERQVGTVMGDLTLHEAAKNPHPAQEEWIRSNTREVAADIGVLRRDIDTDYQGLAEKVDSLRLSRARMGGIAAMAGVFGSIAVEAVSRSIWS